MTDTPLLVACPSCAAMNRLPPSRLRDAPKCGSCHTALFLGTPVALPLLVDFWAPWCGPCLSMAPQFAAAAASLEPQLRLAKVDTDLHPVLGTRFGIRSIPTLLILRNGKELARQSGAMGSTQIIAWARSVLSSH